MLSNELEKLKVKDLMTQKVYSIDCESKVSEALGMMNSEKVHELVVTRKGKLMGIVSYDHLLRRMNIPLNSKVENVLTLPPKISPDSTVVSAAEILISVGIRVAPVTDEDNRILGIISMTDLIKIIPKLKDISRESVGSVMSPAPVCVAENDYLTKAKELMKDLDEQTIPVINSRGELSGIVDIKDISSTVLFKPGRQRHETQSERTKSSIDIRSVMKQPVSVSIETPIGSAVDMMLKNKLGSIIVTAGEKPVGTLTLSNLIELIARKRDAEQVHVQITGLSLTDPFVYDSIDGVIAKNIKIIARFAKPQILTLHVSTYSPSGTVNKYSIRARMNTDKKMYYAQSVEWDVVNATDTVMRKLEAFVRNDKERAIHAKNKPHME